MSSFDPASAARTLRAAIQTGDSERPEAVALALQAVLQDIGLSEVDARFVLVAVGYKPQRQLVELYQSAWFMAKLQREAGTFKKHGTMKAIYAWCADIWSRETGNPSYSANDFKSAYSHWLKRFPSGGITRHERAGFEKRKRLVK